MYWFLSLPLVSVSWLVFSEEKKQQLYFQVPVPLNSRLHIPSHYYSQPLLMLLPHKENISFSSLSCSPSARTHQQGLSPFSLWDFFLSLRAAHTSLFGITRSIDSSTLISCWIKINSQQNKLVIQSHHIHVKCGHAAAANHAPIRRSSIILWITFQLHVSILYAACRVNRRKYVWKAFQLNTFSSFSFPFPE